MCFKRYIHFTVHERARCVLTNARKSCHTMEQYVEAIFKKLYCTIAATLFSHYTQFLLEHDSRKGELSLSSLKSFAFKLQIVYL